MASRREEKERLKAERHELEAQQRTEERRKRLIQYGSAAVLLALCVVAILIVVSQSGDDGGGDPTQIEDVASVQGELQGIPQSGTVLGDTDAGVTVVEFGDLQCPVCKTFSEQVTPDVIAGPVSEGTANYDLRQWPILGPDSITAAKAALAAGEQGRYWDFAELFYRNQGTENSGYVTDEFLEAIAEGAGVQDIARWNEDRDSSRWDSVIETNNTEAQGFGFAGTPSILVEGPGGQRAFTSVPQFAAIQEAIQAVR